MTMEKGPTETITVQFVMNAKGAITEIRDGNGKPAVDEDPTSPTAWASAIVATKHSPGKIYIWTGTRWVCIKV